MQNGTADLTAILSEVPLFRGLDQTVITDIARYSHVTRLQKGKMIYVAGDNPRAFYHVLSGQLKVAVSSAEGGERVIDIISPAHSCGIAELFGNAPYVSFAEAVEPAVLLHIAKEGIYRAIEQEPRIAQRMLSAVAERQSSIERDIAANSFQSGCRRVVDYLLRQAGSSLNPSGNTQLELTIPKHLIAARLGFTPETLSRAFRDLSDAGLISVRGKHVTLLEKLVCRSVTETGEPDENVLAEQKNRHPTQPWFDRPAPFRPVASPAWM